MEKILVGLSGGVDSAISTYLLQQKGYQVVGLFLRLIDDDDFSRAEILAKQLGIKLITRDVRTIFRQQIEKKFIEAYRRGLTPNPCVVCNPTIKFKYLLESADKLNINLIATGHYAQVKTVPQTDCENLSQSKREHINKKNILYRATDQTKDQSYFLYGLSQNVLQRLQLPLGNITKTEVKSLAQELQLQVSRSESQDVCFLKNTNLKQYLQTKLSAETLSPGDIVDLNNQKIGEHQGLALYTIGQRQGLNIGGKGPYYVVAKNNEKNLLIVSNNCDDLQRKKIPFTASNWLYEAPKKNKRYQIQVRYRTKPISAHIVEKDKGNWLAEAEEEIFSIAPGQSLVVYDGDIVVGGGVIQGNI